MDFRTLKRRMCSVLALRLCRRYTRTTLTADHVRVHSRLSVVHPTRTLRCHSELSIRIESNLAGSLRDIRLHAISDERNFRLLGGSVMCYECPCRIRIHPPSSSFSLSTGQSSLRMLRSPCADRHFQYIRMWHLLCRHLSAFLTTSSS